MRINKDIRNYIARRVNEAAAVARANYDTQFSKSDKELQTIIKKSEAIANKAEEQIRALVGKTEFCKINDGWKNLTILDFDSHAIVNLDSINEKRLDAHMEINKKAEQIIEDIIVTISLGGNKEDLEKMLSNIKF